MGKLGIILVIFVVFQVSWAQFGNPAGPPIGGGDPFAAHVHELPVLSNHKLPKDYNGPIPPYFELPQDALVDSPLEIVHKKPPLDTPEIDYYNDHLTFYSWVLSLLSCAAVVACGVLPALIIPIETGAELLRQQAGFRHLKYLLSFAVGSLLGDVFLHLLPELWQDNRNIEDLQYTGKWVLFGLLVCFLAEKCVSASEESQHKICAFMNLAANLIDNFTHGLAVGGSYLVSIRFGLLTTFAILVHEIPHEISDFAILLRADFDRREAIKAQLITAIGGICGACVALLSHSFGSDDITEASCNWILAFTAGGFLNIALVQVLPDLLKEKSSKESVKQMAVIFLGVAVMGVINWFHID